MLETGRWKSVLDELVHLCVGDADSAEGALVPQMRPHHRDVQHLCCNTFGELCDYLDGSAYRAELLQLVDVIERKMRGFAQEKGIEFLILQHVWSTAIGPPVSVARARVPRDWNGFEKVSSVVIVIPTYWTWGSEQRDKLPAVVYDHPTPLDGRSTLPRLLESLARLRTVGFSVLVLTAVTHRKLNEGAFMRVKEAIAPFGAYYPIAQATEEDAAAIRARYPGLAEHVQMRGYAGVRNLQLLLPHALGAEVIVALDDDEVIAPDYLQTALHFVGTEHRGARVVGVAGLYTDSVGSTLLPEGARTGNIFLDKSAIMNEGTRALQLAPGRLVDTPVAFGGNMVFHRSLFTRVGFDPGVGRGEDIDYLINTRLAGSGRSGMDAGRDSYRFWLDKELRVTHLPPEAYGALPYAKLVQDVYRFVYEREKLHLADMDPAQFAPYPGRFLQDDVEEHALVGLRAEATPEETTSLGAPETIIAQARRHAEEEAPRYSGFAHQWPYLMEAVGKDAELCEQLFARLEQSV